MNIHRVYGWILPMFRKRRMRQFTDAFPLGEDARIMDVGGTPMNWRLIRCPAKVTLLNIYSPKEVTEWMQEFEVIQNDARNLCFQDKTYDVAFSNSVIEHLSTFENQQQFAREISRVGRGLWVQTPARWFFFEPHLIAPFIHFFPKPWQRKLIRWCSVWGLVSKPSQAQVDAFLDEVRLLTFEEMQSLFPGCEIIRERFLFFTKSYVAVRKA